MVTSRLSFLLESDGRLSPFQTGFRRGKTPLDNLLRLTADGLATLTARETMAVVFLDLKDAFGSVSPGHVVTTMQNWGYGGHLLHWLVNFLSPRSVRVLTNGSYSRIFVINSGLPQGSPASPTLFNIAINGIGLDFPPRISYGLHADDVALWLRHLSLPALQRGMQDALNLVTAYVERCHLQLQPTKCSYMLITRRRSSLDDFVLHIDGTLLTRVDTFKYLGLWLDHRLLWTTHITYLVTVSLQRLNLLKAVRGHSWGATRSATKLVYTQYIRAKLDYGSILYSTACPTSLRKIDTIHNSALRLILGVPQTTAISAMTCESGLPPPEYRRHQLELNLLARRPALTDAAVLDVPCRRLLPVPRQPLPHRLAHLAHTLRLRRFTDTAGIVLSLSDRTPAPWTPPGYTVVDDWLPRGKRDFTAVELRSYFYLTMDSLTPVSPPTIIYTDASKTPDHSVSSIAVYFPSLAQGFTANINPDHCIARLELLAIYYALFLGSAGRHTPLIICSDSRSSLTALKSVDHSDPLYHAIRRLCSITGQTTIFLWTPAHCGIAGNEQADLLSKAASRLRPAQLHVWLPYDASTLKRLYGEALKADYTARWRESPEGRTQREYCQDPFLVPIDSMGLSQPIETFLSLLHCRRLPTSSWISRIGRSPTPDCLRCGTADTPAHVFLDCLRYRRQQAHLASHFRTPQLPLTYSRLLGSTLEGHRDVIFRLFTLWRQYCLDNHRF